MSKRIGSGWDPIMEKVDYAFQPIVNIHTGVTYGFEALIRNVDEAGFDSIAAFFDQADHESVLNIVHEALFEKAFEKINRLAWGHQVKLFYNLDSRLFHAKNFQTNIDIRLPQCSQLPKDTICLEISERHEICHVEHLTDKLSLFRKIGCKIAVDDFGAGFSGLQLLYFTRPDYVKIDRFYIHDIEKDPSKRMLAASIVSIAHLMGSLVIAEGVETQMEYYCCKNIGCDLLQGYLVQKPQLDVECLQQSYDEIYDLNINDRRNANRRDESLIQSEIIYIDPIAYETRLIKVLDMFKENKSNTFFPVVNRNGEALGIIREERIKEFAYSEYGRYLMANPTFDKTIDDFMYKIPVVDIHTPVEKILETFSINENLEGILITHSMKYVGFLSAHSLIKIINEKNLAAARDQNPLSKLPGNEMIYEYVSNALKDSEETYVLMYFDFDNFKVYNDTYGFRQGDRVILLFAELLKQHAQSPKRFAGHVGGDDFFMGVKGQPLDSLTSEVRAMAAKFRSNVESFYDIEAIKKGYIQALDRDGQMKCFPLITVSTALLELPAAMHRFYSPEEISNSMAEMKKEAKTSTDKICAVNLAHFDKRSLPQSGRTGDPNVIDLQEHLKNKTAG